MNKFIFTLLISMNGLLSTAYANTDFDMTLYDSAKAGNAQSQFELATKYYELSTDEGYVKTKEYFGQACDKGDQDGCDEYKKLNMLKNYK